MYGIDSHVDDTDGRWAVVTVRVPVAPQVAFDAVATGEGISSWFVPCAMEPHVGGRVVQFADPGAPDPTTGPEAAAEASLTASVGEVTEYDLTGRRFTFVEKSWAGEGIPVPDWETSFAVAPTEHDGESGALITLRSGFSIGGPLVDEAITDSVTGWADSLHVLAHRFTHAPEAGVVAVHAATEPRPGQVEAGWAQVRRALLGEALPSDTPPNDAGHTAVGAVARHGTVGGIVLSESAASLSVVLSSPVDGICQVYAFPAGDSPDDAAAKWALAVRVHEYVDGPGGELGAAAVDGAPTWDTPTWREWLDGLVGS